MGWCVPCGVGRKVPILYQNTKRPLNGEIFCDIGSEVFKFTHDKHTKIQIVRLYTSKIIQYTDYIVNQSSIKQ